MAQLMSAEQVVQLFSGEDPNFLSEAMCEGSDDDFGLDWDSDGHESDSEPMHEGM